MKFQEKTIVDPHRAIGHKGQGYLVGIVFFPFDSADLDARDKEELNKLYRAYSKFLLKWEIQFTFIGYADYRGNKKYNRRLGIRRAQAVKKHLDGMFRRFANYSGEGAMSWGEALAAQPTRGKKPSRDRMALDRSVHIIASRPPRRVIEIPPVKIEGVSNARMRRIVGREFSKRLEDSNLQPKTHSDKFWETITEEMQNWIRKLKQGGKESAFYGQENIKSRTYRQVLRYFRVNDVYVRNNFQSETISIFGQQMVWSTSVVYIWGDPKPVVNIHIRFKKQIEGKPTKEGSKRIVIRRELAEEIYDLLAPAVE